MESIYNPALFRSSEHLELRTYFEEFSKLTETIDRNILSNNELAKLCSIDKLTVDEEPSWLPLDRPDVWQSAYKLDFPYPITPAAKRLNSVQIRESMEPEKPQDQVMQYNKRFFRTRTLLNTDGPSLGDITPGSDFIYSIIVYKPFSIKYLARNSSDNLRFAFELEALGSNKLSDIADNIKCPTNYGLMKKVESTTENLSHLLNAKAHYPSQTIFIDGVFYNDTRIPGSIDYSKEIIPWAESKGIGKFTTGRMQLTLLDSIKPRLGYPYVYIHQGNCEHIFCFSDARLISKGDILHCRRYPRMVSVSRPSSILCFICSKSSSKWLVCNCDRFPHEKVFLCTMCCNSFLFVNGEPVTKFDLYPYFDRDD